VASGAAAEGVQLAGNARLRALVAAKLRQDWSPEQIAGWLRIAFGGQDALQVSHETIYVSLYVQARGVLGTFRNSV
jgi:IS30 family transposase